MNLSDIDKSRIIAFIRTGEKLPKKYIYKLLADEDQYSFSSFTFYKESA